MKEPLKVFEQIREAAGGRSGTHQAGADILTGGTSGLFLKGKTVKSCCTDMLRIAERAKGEQENGINE